MRVTESHCQSWSTDLDGVIPNVVFTLQLHFSCRYLPLICFSTNQNIQLIHSTTGHEGSVGDVSCMSIFSACFGLLTSLQLASTTWSGQIWISCWILPHFDVRTISVASKLKELQIFLYYWQKIFDGTKLHYDGERSSGCECLYLLPHCTVGALWASILMK